MGVEWRRQLNETSQLWVAPQYAWVSYSGANQPRDVDLTSLAVGYRQWWLTGWQPVLDVVAFGGDERSTQDRPDLARDLLGATAVINVSPSPQWALTAAVSYVRSNYDGAIPIIDVTRHDNNSGHRCRRRLFLHPQLERETRVPVHAQQFEHFTLRVRAQRRGAQSPLRLSLEPWTRHARPVAC